MKDKDQLVIYGQYYGCWWPGNRRSQVINRKDIDLVLCGYSCPLEGLIYSGFIHVSNIMYASVSWDVLPQYAEWFWGTHKKYIHIFFIIFLAKSFLMEPTHATQVLPWLLMIWWQQDSGHQQSWCWYSYLSTRSVNTFRCGDVKYVNGEINHWLPVWCQTIN